jgi:alkylhydroperoxidase family enzyme
MPRIPLADIESVEFMRILANRPEVMEKWTALDTATMFQGLLSPNLKYKVQTSLATNGDCEFCRSMIEPMTEDDRKESLAVAFALLCQEDPGGLTDAHYKTLYEEFSPAEVVELCVVIAFKIGGLALGGMWALEVAPPGVKEAYDGMVAEAQKNWEEGREESGESLWEQQATAASSA